MHNPTNNLGDLNMPPKEKKKKKDKDGLGVKIKRGKEGM
jgi:hypothetical protein